MISADIVDVYAIQLARFPNDGLKAALIATKEDMGMALELVAQCRQDAEFEFRQRELIEETGAKPYIPSKEMVIVEIMSIARNQELAGDLRLRAYKLGCEVAGYVSDKTGLTINNNVQNRVMQVSVFKDAGEWEETAVGRQQKLIDAAYAKSNA